MFVNARVPDPASVIIACIRRLENLTVKRGFESLNVHRGHSRDIVSKIASAKSTVSLRVFTKCSLFKEVSGR